MLVYWSYGAREVQYELFFSLIKKGEGIEGETSYGVTIVATQYNH